MELANFPTVWHLLTIIRLWLLETQKVPHCTNGVSNSSWYRAPKSYRILTKITLSDSADQRTPLNSVSSFYLKNVEFCIFCQKTDHGCDGCVFFFSGVMKHLVPSSKCTVLVIPCQCLRNCSV